MVSKNWSTFGLIAIFLILVTPTVQSSDYTTLYPMDANKCPSSLSVQTRLPDPDMDETPNVIISGSSNEFSGSHLQSVDADGYVSLQWFHSPRTALGWVDGWSNSSDLPASRDFIYFTQEFDWDLETMPSDVFMNMSFSIESTGDFNTVEGELMFSIQTWLIDSSGNWGKIYHSQSPNNETISVIGCDLNYNDIRDGWRGMIEDSSGIQDDPSDTLTFAVGLAPNIEFQSYMGSNPWTEYDGIVTVKIFYADLYTLMNLEPEPDEVLVPLANNTWGSKVKDVFPDFIGENYDVDEWCKTIATDTDSSVYVLANSIIYSEKNEETGDYFRYPTILKYDSEMNLVWFRKYHDWTFGFDICVKNGFIYLVGAVMSGETVDLFLTKWDAFGNIIWDVRWDTGVDERGCAVGVTDDGAVYVLSEIDPMLRVWLEIDGALLKFDANGVLEWNVTVDHPVSTYYYSDLEIVDDGIVTSDGLYCTFWNFLGVQQWSTFYRSITADSDGNLFTSEVYRTERGEGLQFKKMFSNGTIQWSTNFTMSYAGIWESMLRWPSMSIAPDGSLLAYTVEEIGWMQNHILVKFNAEGEYQWHKEIKHDVSLPFGGSVAYMSVAPNGIAYFVITMSSDVHVYSYDVGVSIFYNTKGLLFLAAVSISIVGISIILIERYRRVDFLRVKKVREEGL